MSLDFTVSGVSPDKFAIVAGYSGGTIPASLTIPETYTDIDGTYPVTTIGNNAFDSQTDLTSITLPDSITGIGNFAFYGCGLTSITIPQYVTYVGISAFENCSFLNTVTIAPDSALTEFQTYAFNGCVALETVTFSSGSIFSNIEIGVFQNCTSLQTIVFPSSLTRITNDAFKGCAALDNLTMPESVNEIGDSVFNGCTLLSAISFLGNKPTFGTEVFVGTAVGFTVTAQSNRGWSNPLVIGSESYPVNILGIQYAVSAGSATVTGYNGTIPASLVIPNVYYDGNETYFVTAIGNNAFDSQTDLTSITLPDSITGIGDLAFLSCGLPSITIPENVTQIGDSAFNGCTLLSAITFLGNKPTFGTEVFIGTAVGFTVTAQRDRGWSNPLVILSDPTGSESYPVIYLGIQYAVSADSATVTGYNGTIPASLTIPETYTDDTGTTYTVTAIGNNAFDSQFDLTEVVLPDTITRIGNFAFVACGLTSITIPPNVEIIGNHAFEACPLVTVTFAPGSILTNLEVSAFTACAVLEAITIPESLSSVSNRVFFGCTLLSAITFLGNKPTFGTEVFVGTAVGFTITAQSNRGWSNPLVIGSESYPVNILGIQYTVSAGSATVTGYNGTIPASLFIPNVYYDGNTSYFVTAIGNNAFDSQTDLIDVVLPDSLTRIGNEAFKSCGITSVVIPATVETIGVGAFGSCSALVTIAFPDNSALTSIGNEAFQSCGIESITVPAAVTAIGNSVFEDSSALNRITFLGNKPTFGADVFVGTAVVTINAYPNRGWTNPLIVNSSVGGPLSYPVSIIENNFEITVSSDGTATIVGYTAPPDLPSDLVIPATYTDYRGTYIVTGIGSSAFANSTGVTSVSFPPNLTTIGDFAFSNVPLTLISFSSVNPPSLGRDVFLGAATNLFTVVAFRSWPKYIDN